MTLFFEPTDVNKAVRIAWCESRFDPDAQDLRTGGIGLFNHLPRYWEDAVRQRRFPRCGGDRPRGIHRRRRLGGVPRRGLGDLQLPLTVLCGLVPRGAS